MSEWERVDTAVATPRRFAAGTTSTTSSPTHARLRRSRNPVLSAFDQGGRVFRRRLRDVSLGAAAILVPAVALNLWVTIVVTDGFEADSTLGPLFSDASAGSEDIGALLVAIGISLTTAVVGHLCAQILLGEVFGQPVGAITALGRTARALPAVSVAWFLTHWWFVVAAAIITTAPADAAIGLTFLGSPIVLLASSAVVLVVPVMVAEGLGPLRAIRRGWQLARLRFGTCVGFVALATLLGTLFAIGITTLIPLIDQFGFLRFGDAAPTVVAVMAQLAVLFVVPLIALATARFYVELRLSAEGLDVTIDAAAAFDHSSRVVR